VVAKSILLFNIDDDTQRALKLCVGDHRIAHAYDLEARNIGSCASLSQTCGDAD
jgi:hypothetical protein